MLEISLRDGLPQAFLGVRGEGDSFVRENREKSKMKKKAVPQKGKRDQKQGERGGTASLQRGTGRTGKKVNERGNHGMGTTSRKLSQRKRDLDEGGEEETKTSLSFESWREAHPGSSRKIGGGCTQKSFNNKNTRKSGGWRGFIRSRASLGQEGKRSHTQGHLRLHGVTKGA